MRALAVFVTSLLILGPVGCAHRTPLPTAAPELKPETGTLGLAVTPGPYSPNFQRPGAVGASEGAKRGAKTGAIAPLVPGAAFIAAGAGGGDPRVVVAGLFLAGAGIALAPVGAAVGAAVGALSVPSREDVERSATALERAFADANLPEALMAWIVEAGGERPIVFAGDPASPTMDTILALDAPQVSLTSKDPSDWKPGLRLRVSIRATLRRASDGEHVRSWSWEHEGPKANFLEWGKDDARMFRTELERAGRALAAEMIADIF